MYKELFYEFEKYCCKKHQYDFPKQKTYHWCNIPEELLYDSGFITSFHDIRIRRKNDYEDGKINSIQEYGLDGITFDEINNIYNVLQMKCYDPKYSLSANDLGTFLSCFHNRICIKNPNSIGYLYHTSSLTKNFNIDFKNSRKLFDVKIDNVIDVLDKERNILNDKVCKKENEFELKYYQIEALEELRNNMNNDYSVKLMVLPCGTGKTIIFCNHLKERKYKRVFIFSPLKVHVKQTMDRVKLFLPEYEYLLVDSDNTGTTNIDDIKNILTKYEKTVLSITFDSVENLIPELFYEDVIEEDYIEEDDESFDEDYDDDESNINKMKCHYDLSDSIVIVDECHNLINNNKLIDIIKYFPNVLTLTATPPSKIEEIMSSELIYEYKFANAIKDNAICDYRIYLPLVDKKDENEFDILIDIPEELENDIKNIDENLYKKGLFLINGMLQKGCRRCIAYLSSIEECFEFEKVIINIMDKYHSLPFIIYNITSNTEYKKRNDVLKNFEKDEIRLDTIKIICSVRILDEGVDLVKCDSVFISKITQNSNDIRLIQRMCRANRLDKNNINKLANCFIWCEDIVNSISTLEMLKNNDCELSKKIKIIGSNYERNDDDNVNIEKIVSGNKNICEYINVKCMGVVDLWMYKLNLAKTFMDKNKRRPNKKKIDDEKKHGNFLNDMQKIYKIKSGIMKIEKVYDEYKKFLDEYGEYMRTFEEIWFLKKDLLFKYCNEFNKIPNSKKINIGGMWFQHQKKKIKSNNDDIYKILAENEILKKDLDRYLAEKEKNKDKIILSFDESKDLLFKYCNEFNKIPNSKKINIGMWFQRQKKKIKSNNDDIYKILAENEILKKDLDRYLAEKEKNKDKIILSFDESKDLLFKYCNEFNKIPNSKKINIGMWFQRQKKKIKSNNDDIYKILAENKIVKKELDRFLSKKI